MGLWVHSAGVQFSCPAARPTARAPRSLIVPSSRALQGPMKKFFSKLGKGGRQGEGDGPPSHLGEPGTPVAGGGGVAGVPPLDMQQLPPEGQDQYGRPVTPGYSGSGYLQQQASGTGRSSGGRPISRTQSGMSSGRRSARRPREFIDLSQPEQVDGSSCSGSYSGSDAGADAGADADAASVRDSAGNAGDAAPAAGAAGAAEAAAPAAADWQELRRQREQADAELALAYQLAMAGQQQPPPPLLQRPQQQQTQQGGQPPPLQQSAPSSLQPQTSFWSRASLSLRPGRGSRGSRASSSSFGPPPLSEDVFAAASRAESQFAAQQRAELARAGDEAYQVHTQPMPAWLVPAGQSRPTPALPAAPAPAAATAAMPAPQHQQAQAPRRTHPSQPTPPSCACRPPRCPALCCCRRHLTRLWKIPW